MCKIWIAAVMMASFAAIGSAHAFTLEERDNSGTGSQSQIADPDEKLQQRMGMGEGPGSRTFNFQGSGFSFRMSGPQNLNDDQSGQLRFGPSTPSDRRPRSVFGSAFGSGWQ